MTQVLRCQLDHLVTVDDPKTEGMACRLCRNILRWHPWPHAAAVPNGVMQREVDEGADRETAVEHVQNARQLVALLVGELREAQATNYAPLVRWVESLEATDKRLLKVLVQIKRATAALTP